MVSITVRNLDDELERRLRERALENGRTLEEEAGEILRSALGGRKGPDRKVRDGDTRVV